MEALRKLRVLFMGAGHRGEALRERAEDGGAYLGVASTVEETVGLYLLQAPDVVVVDGEGWPELAQEAYTHLSSVGARPLVVLAGEVQACEWSEPVSEGTIVVECSGSYGWLLEILADTSRRIPSLFTMDTHSGSSTEWYRGAEAHARSR